MNRLLTALAATDQPLVMGIVNVTPDSFSDGGRLISVDAAVDHALALAAQGAAVLDIGGESTRPGAVSVSEADERARVLPVIAALRARTDIAISIDTRKPAVARAAVAAGADCWNDVSALTFADDSLETAVALSVPVILMHASDGPETMQNNPQYRDVTAEVCDFLVRQIGACINAGLRRDHVLVDPGIGFGKTLAHNLQLMRVLGRVVDLGRPVLFGASRKRFIAGIDPDATETGDRLGGSIAAAMWAARRGARLLRVHDVRETVQALRVWRAIADFES